VKQSILSPDYSNFYQLTPRIIIVSAGSDLNIIVIDSVGTNFRKPLYMAYCRIHDLDTALAADDVVNKQ